MLISVHLRERRGEERQTRGNISVPRRSVPPFLRAPAYAPAQPPVRQSYAVRFVPPSFHTASTLLSVLSTYVLSVRRQFEAYMSPIKPSAKARPFW